MGVLSPALEIQNCNALAGLRLSSISVADAIPATSQKRRPFILAFHLLS
jgi:hypothetical protein